MSRADDRLTLIRYRPFLNGDAPALAEVWRSQPPMRGLVQPMSASLLEDFVFWKPYFDREGLIVATEDERVVGFAHAGFGPCEDRSSLSTELGVTSMLMTHTQADRATISVELLGRSEQYLISRGARVLYGGGIRPLDPFYLGLYGGSELPGILASDEQKLRLFLDCGYREVDRVIVMQRELNRFRMPVDRR